MASDVIRITVVGDTWAEADEDLFVTLSAPTNVTLNDAQGRGVITNTDSAPGVSIDPGTAAKAGQPLVFTLRLSAPAGQAVNVTYTMNDGTAVAGVDYVATSNVVTFNPGQLVRTVSVQTIADAPERDETMSLLLIHVTNATIVTPSRTGTIRNRRKGDLNGDGQPDLLWHHPDGRLEAWFMNGSTQTQAVAVTPVAGTIWEVMGIGDFNGDGRQDFVWQHPDGSLAVWLMADTTLIDSAPLLPAPSSVSDPNWKIRGVGDVNQDGWPDFYWQHVTTGQLAVWVMNGLTRQWSALLNPSQVADTNWRLAGVGDINADGSPDLWWQNSVTTQVSAWLMNGTTQTSGTLLTPSTVPPEWQIAGSVDLNVNGTPDLLWQNVNTGQVSVWWMSGLVMQSADLMTPAQMVEAGWRLVGPR